MGLRAHGNQGSEKPWASASTGFALSTLEELAGYMRKASMWPVTFGLACCAIEMMAVGTPDYDIARFGMGGSRRRRGRLTSCSWPVG